MSIFSFLNRAPRPERMDVRFHTDTNHFGTHGTLRASHVGHKLNNAVVRFVFVGQPEAPKLTLEQLAYLWAEAKFQGYIPHELLSYNLLELWKHEGDASAEVSSDATDATGMAERLSTPAFQRRGNGGGVFELQGVKS